MNHIISASQFNKNDLDKILTRTEGLEREVKEGKVKKLLENKIVACIFFEPSTRTRLSFETAALKLGAEVISSENAENSSSAFKGESIEDTTRILDCYADVIVMRHPKAGTPAAAAKVSDKPIINAGDGNNEHPSQAFLDLYTIKKEHGGLNNLHVAFGGDLLNSRTLRSLVPFLQFYEGNTFYFISPEALALPKEYTEQLKRNNVVFKEMRTLEEALPLVDVLYMTRVQKERFPDPAEYAKVKDLFILKQEHMKLLKKDAIIMHPLPKINEIEKEVDLDPRAAYFRQAQNGLYVRMALLLHALGL